MLTDEHQARNANVFQTREMVGWLWQLLHEQCDHDRYDPSDPDSGWKEAIDYAEDRIKQFCGCFEGLGRGATSLIHRVHPYAEWADAFAKEKRFLPLVNQDGTIGMSELETKGSITEVHAVVDIKNARHATDYYDSSPVGGRNEYWPNIVSTWGDGPFIPVEPPDGTTDPELTGFAERYLGLWGFKWHSLLLLRNALSSSARDAFRSYARMQCMALYRWQNYAPGNPDAERNKAMLVAAATLTRNEYMSAFPNPILFKWGDPFTAEEPWRRGYLAYDIPENTLQRDAVDPVAGDSHTLPESENADSDDRTTTRIELFDPAWIDRSDTSLARHEQPIDPVLLEVLMRNVDNVIPPFV